MVISSVLDCESVWTLTVDILNTICNRDCFADCSLDLTQIVSFWKIAFLVCRWRQIIISQSWNWTHLQFSTQFSNGCQCVLCNFQWFLFSIISVTVLYTGGLFFRDTLYILCLKKGATFIFAITLANVDRFLSRVSTLTRDIDIAILSVRPSVCLSVRPSVCPSVRPSVTFRYQMKTA